MKGIGNPDDLKQIMLLEVNYIAVCHYYQLRQSFLLLNRFTINAYSTRGRLPANV